MRNLRCGSHDLSDLFACYSHFPKLLSRHRSFLDVPQTFQANLSVSVRVSPCRKQKVPSNSVVEESLLKGPFTKVWARLGKPIKDNAEPQD